MTSSTIAWLSTDAPTSRRQAVLGNIYRGVTSILRNPTALVGLIIVALLLGAAIFAPQLSGQSPIAQDLPNRLTPPSAARGGGAGGRGRGGRARARGGARGARAGGARGAGGGAPGGRAGG